MKKDITDYITHCEICQKAKPSNHLPYGLLQPLPVPTLLWSDLTMDFIIQLPKSDNYINIMIIVDRLSRAAYFAPLTSPITAPLAATIFWETVGKLHGLPTSIVSDRDPIF